METWKDVNGYENYYQVSNFGNIKSLSRIINRRNGAYLSKEKVLKTAIKYDGYAICVLYNEKEKQTVIVHRVVAKTFINNPENKPEVNHINGKRSDNRVENLEWNTAKENIKNSIESGRWDSRLIPVIQKNIQGQIINSFSSISSAGRETGVNEYSIRACINGKRKTAGGFTWINVISNK